MKLLAALTLHQLGFEFFLGVRKVRPAPLPSAPPTIETSLAEPSPAQRPSLAKCSAPVARVVPLRRVG